MERPTDDLVQRILAAATAGERARSLVEDARTEAEAEVKDLLKTALKAVLLRQAVTELEGNSAPPLPSVSAAAPAPAPTIARPAATHTACYVYGITRTAWGTPPADLRGLDGRSPLRVVSEGDLQAITSDVSLEEFGPGVIDERLKDLAWVEQKVRGHDAVVKALSAAGTVIPCRFCTILPGAEDARGALRRHHDAIGKTLDRIDGKREWGVKLLADTRASAAPTAPRESASPEAGRAYLVQKQRHGSRRDDVLRAAQSAAEACHLELSSLAADAALLPTRDRGGARGWHLALNAAYLVPDADKAPFHARVESLSQQYRPQGLRIDLTGPWPPYNFAALDLSEAAT